jgi:hypothetical protein
VHRTAAAAARAWNSRVALRSNPAARIPTGGSSRGSLTARQRSLFQTASSGCCAGLSGSPANISAGTPGENADHRCQVREALDARAHVAAHPYGPILR